MADSQCSIDELMKRDVSHLQNLCKSYHLPSLGAKRTLASRIRNYMLKNAPDQNAGESKDLSMIGKLCDQLAMLDAKFDAKLSETNKLVAKSENNISAKVGQLEQDIDVLYNRYMHVEHSTPASNSGASNYHIVATSNEPGITYNRRKNVHHSLPSAIPSQSHNLSDYHSDIASSDHQCYDSSDHVAIQPPKAKPRASLMNKTWRPTPAPRSLSRTAQDNQGFDSSESHGRDGYSDCHASHSHSCGDSHFTSALRIEERITKVMSNGLRSAQRRVAVPKTFSGNPLEYHEWNKSFLRLIGDNESYSIEEKMFYLGEYTSGPVHDLVSGYNKLDGIEAYEKVLSIIYRRYGHPHKIAQAYEKKLSEWPTIQSEDPIAVQRLCDFLVNCQSAMLSAPNLSYLNHAKENARLKQLLPPWLKRRWNRIAITYSSSHDEQFPPFDMFVEFLIEQSELLNHPIATDGEEQITLKGSEPQTSLSSKKSNVVHSTTGSEVDTRQRDKQKCLLCSNNHRLYRCDSFKSLEPADRNAFVIKHRLCVICLNENHGENKCRFNIQCKACGKRSIHNPLLHDALVVEGKSNESIKATSHSVSSFEKSIVYHKSGDTSYIIPVYLSRKDNPGNEVLTYALLDAQSDITFVTDNVAQSVTQPLGSKKWIDLSTMSSTNELVLCNRYNDLIVRGYSCDERLTLRKSAYGCDNIPHNLQVPCSDDVAKWPHLAGVAHKFPPVFECGIGLLIGRNCHYATFPAESVGSPSPSDPYAVRTPLGWTMVGPVESSQANTEVSHRVVFQAEVPTDLRMKDINSGVSAPFVCHVTTRYSPSNARAVPMDVVKQLESGFDMIGDSNHTESSLDDMEFIKILENGIEQENDGFYSMPLPFRGGRPPDFPNNRAQAVSRLKSLDRKLTDPNLFEKYDQFMRNMITSGDAEPIPANELNSSNVWYLPHHRVVNPKKPTKVRVVFDASCSFRGFSLNKSLLPGPDLNNSLVGVLTRFRERNVAVSCDIEKMFYRFRVNKDHRDFLRFLWYDDERNITEFRMSKHIFGAASSPGCAKYGLLRLAKDHSGDSPLAQWFIERCFYVDDGLFSCDTVDEATKLLTDTARICQLGNLKLHKMMSNEVSVLKSFPPSDLACDLSLLKGGVSVSERTLGIEWSPATDCFTFSAPIAHPDTVTRRNMLHLVASLFDPLGFIAPVVLTGKLILQRACHGMDWDEPVSEELAKLWDSWLIVLGSLNELFIPRCLKATVLGLVSQRVELHTYSDACEKGYGSCCYLRLLGTDGTVVTSLLFGKSRVVPLKGSTMPRLELQAAVLGAKIGTQLASELSVDLDSCYYWCDSTIALANSIHSKQQEETEELCKEQGHPYQRTDILY